MQARRFRSILLTTVLAMTPAGAGVGARGPAVSPTGSAAPPPSAGTSRPPALVVVIVVDQLRGDLLDRYDAAFSAGFRRLRERGLRFERAEVDHAVTVSHPGHVTISTGLVPARHGIVDAAFYEGPPGDRRFVDALEDPAERIPGAPGAPGVSPRRILAPTLPEWIESADPDARVVAVGSGPYSSLLHAGHARGDVVWFWPQAGRFVTSSFYAPAAPDWVERFNREILPGIRDASIDWTSRVPEPLRALAGPDAAPWEADGVHTAFPHRLADEASPEAAADPARRALWLADTPFLDEATLLLARAGVAARALGRRRATDYLGIVVSQTDDMGHWYGPRSQEQLDNLVRLDRDLGDFFDFLDREVGRDRWVAAITADHGVASVPTSGAHAERPGRRVRAADMRAVLRAARAAIDAHPGDPGAAAEAAADAARAFDFVAAALTPAELLGTGAAPSADPYLRLCRNSYRADRVPRFPIFDFETGESDLGRAGVMVRLARGDVPDLDPGVHGSPYFYDRDVPLVFMGAGVRPGVSEVEARTVDVAPTLARLAGIPAPEGLDGRPLVRPDGRPVSGLSRPPGPDTAAARRTAARPDGGAAAPIPAG